MSGWDLLKDKRCRALIGVLLVSFLVRVAVIYGRFEHLDADPDAYRLLGENLANHGGFGQVGSDGQLRPTAYRPPGYPLVLSLLVSDQKLSSGAVAILHLLLGMVTVAIVFHIGSSISVRIGVLASVLLAIDPLLLNQSALVMTETLATLLVALVWWITIALPVSGQSSTLRQHVLWGAVLGSTLVAGFFVRPVFIVWAAFIIVVYLWLARQNRQIFFVAASASVVIAISVGWWMHRNKIAIGKPVWATTHGGYTLLLGNNPPFYKYLQSMQFGDKWDAEFFHQRWSERRHGDPTTESFWSTRELATKPDDRGLSEIEDDALASNSAKAAISRQPGVFVYSCLVRTGRLWSPIPHRGDLPNALRLAICLFYLVSFALIALGLRQLSRARWQSHWVIAILLLFALSGVHSLYWSNMRMRSMATPMLAVAAAIGADRLLAKWSPNKAV